MPYERTACLCSPTKCTTWSKGARLLNYKPLRAPLLTFHIAFEPFHSLLRPTFKDNEWRNVSMFRHIIVSGLAMTLATTAVPALAKGKYTCKSPITGVGYSDASPPQTARSEARKLARQDYLDKATAAYGGNIYNINTKQHCIAMRGGAFTCYYTANPCEKNTFKPSPSRIKHPHIKPNTRRLFNRSFTRRPDRRMKSMFRGRTKHFSPLR